MLAPTKKAVLAELGKRKAAGLNPEPFLRRASGLGFYNTSDLDMGTLVGDQDNIRENLFSYMQGFSPDVRDIFESFEFHAQIDRLAKNRLLYMATERFARIDLRHTSGVQGGYRRRRYQRGFLYRPLVLYQASTLR